MPVIFWFAMALAVCFIALFAGGTMAVASWMKVLAGPFGWILGLTLSGVIVAVVWRKTRK